MAGIISIYILPKKEKFLELTTQASLNDMISASVDTQGKDGGGHSHGIAGELEHGIPVIWVLLAFAVYGMYLLVKSKK